MALLKRYQRFLALLIPLVSLHIFHLKSIIPTVSLYPSYVLSSISTISPLPFPSSPPLDILSSFKVLSPYILLLSFALYALIDISVTVKNFNDCEDAAAEIERQVKEGRRALKERGIKLRD